MGIPWKPTHKGFKKKSYEEMTKSSKRFASRKSKHRRDKDDWNRDWKRDHAHLKYCWSCSTRGHSANPITQMHATKQVEIRTEADARRCAWVCCEEHKSYDEATGPNVHEEMAAFVDGLIEKMGDEIIWLR